MTKKITVINSDSKIWNLDEVVWQLASSTEELCVDLNFEGPCIKSLGLYDLLRKSNAQGITLKTANALEFNWPNIDYSPPIQFVTDVTAHTTNLAKNKNLKKFGMFIGRSNIPRLLIASQVYKLDSIFTFHYSPKIDFHRDNLGLEQLLERYGKQYFYDACNLVMASPIELDSSISYPIARGQHLNSLLLDQYNDFFVEIACESYFTGKTFFPTEKTWRAITMRTPFIIQGPQNYLKNLKLLGFKTFDRWWDEGYSEDPADYQPLEILKVIEYLNTKTLDEIYNMYLEMHDILEHNYQTLQSLKTEDFFKVRHGQ
jgi:hypothetical protein